MCISFLIPFSPYLKNDVVEQEKIQRAAVKKIIGKNAFHLEND